jgi:predicted DNA-binding transcriptional regulator AlpA
MKYDVKDIIDVQGVSDLIGVFSRVQVYELLDTHPLFPKPILDLGEDRVRLWSKKHILAWLKTNKKDFKRSYVYFAESNKHLKIGVSTNPRARVNAIRGDIYNYLQDEESRRSLKLIGYFPGSLATERSLQKMFAKHQVTNYSPRLKTTLVCKEWFHDRPEIRKYMNKLIEKRQTLKM